VNSASHIRPAERRNSRDASVQANALDCAGCARTEIARPRGIYRTFYYARSPLGILVFHAFVKKTESTSKHDVELGRKRLKELLDEKI
jgi:phage-related protein